MVEIPNFHTHKRTSTSPSKAVVSYSLFQLEQLDVEGLFTIGLHPWDTERREAREWVEERLEAYLRLPNCLALGEVGLDRLRGASLPLQIDLLTLQLSIAARFAKPVVLHCVRCWSELIALFRRLKYPFPVAIHGFRASSEILSQCVAEGWYISLGIDKRGEVVHNAHLVPIERLLLETDDQPDSIDSVCAQVAAARGVSVVTLAKEVCANTNRFFSLT